jgi:hypothetical protein
VKKRPKKRATLPLKKIKRRRQPSAAEIRQIKAAAKSNPPKGTKTAQQLGLLPFAPEPESMTIVEIEIERKLSAKIIVGKRIGKIEAPTDLFTVIGIATGLRTGQSTYGEWTGLKGEFEVVRCEDGKVLQAPIMILPDAAMARLASCVWPTSFAFLVRVVPSLNEQGFEYEVKDLVPPQPFNALDELRMLIVGQVEHVG